MEAYKGSHWRKDQIHRLLYTVQCYAVKSLSLLRSMSLDKAVLTLW